MILNGQPNTTESKHSTGGTEEAGDTRGKGGHQQEATKRINSHRGSYVLRILVALCTTATGLYFYFLLARHRAGSIASDNASTQVAFTSTRAQIQPEFKYNPSKKKKLRGRGDDYVIDTRKTKGRADGSSVLDDALGLQDPAATVKTSPPGSFSYSMPAEEYPFSNFLQYFSYSMPTEGYSFSYSISPSLSHDHSFDFSFESDGGASSYSYEYSFDRSYGDAFSYLSHLSGLLSYSGLSYSYSVIYESSPATVMPLPTPRPSVLNFATLTSFASCTSTTFTGCDAAVSFDLSAYPHWVSLSLSINNMHGDIDGGYYGNEYADVYVGGTVIPNLHCSSGNECDSSSTWSCLTEMDVSSYVTVGASSVEVMLSGASGAGYCDPSLAADVVLVVTYGASPSSVPTI